MEQTLGKRIMQQRKKLGLTQDQLAERLGVTAQAVSKWENDQSCPDITTLPKLAEIFGVTTDELLGREAPRRESPVHQAEVVEEPEMDGLHIQHGKWEFKWDSGRRSAVCFALMVLLVGGLTLAARIMSWDVGFWEILWPTAVLTFGLNGLLGKFSFFSLGCALFGGYILLSNLGVMPFVFEKEYVFPVLIILFGLSLLADALKKPKKHRFHFSTKPEQGESKRRQYEAQDDEFEFNASFGEATQEVMVEQLRSGEVNCSFGDYRIDLQGVERVLEDCELEVNCSFGQVTLLVPSRFRVRPDSSTAFGDLSISGQPDSEPQGTIRLEANVSFGQIVVEYI